jgi:hypothetical protein
MPVPEFGLEDSQVIFGDQIESAAAWTRGTDVSSLQGRALRMRVVVEDADLFSFRFA